MPSPSGGVPHDPREDHHERQSPGAAGGRHHAAGREEARGQEREDRPHLQQGRLHGHHHGRDDILRGDHQPESGGPYPGGQPGAEGFLLHRCEDAVQPHRKGLQGEPEEQVRGDGARHPCRHHHGIRARGRAPEFHPLPLHHAGHHPGALRRHDDFLPVLLQPLGGTAVRLNGCGVFRLFRFVEESRIALFCIGAPRAQSTIVCRAIVSRNSQPIFRT